MPGKPTTVAKYLAALPKDRRDALQALRKVILANLDKDYAEGMQYGMPGYYVPHSVYPPGYHCDRTQPLPYLGMASQKNHMSMHMFCLYTSESEQLRFREAWAKTGKKLDMGKSCIRFKSIDDLPLDVIGKTVKRTTAKRFIAAYEAAFGDSSAAKKTAKKKAKKTAATTKKKVRKRTTKAQAR